MTFLINIHFQFKIILTSITDAIESNHKKEDTISKGISRSRSKSVKESVLGEILPSQIFFD